MTQALFVAWRGGDESNGIWGPVGRLDYVDGVYRYVYTRGAENLPGFTPFTGMPDLHAVYEADELFPLFVNRLLSRSRPEYADYLNWCGFQPDPAPDPLTLLAVTGGARVTDSVEVFPCPEPSPNGDFVCLFFLHGMRWIPAAALERSHKLGAGERLALLPDVQNPVDPNAVAVRTCAVRDRYLIGYLPRYWARAVRNLLEACAPEQVRLEVKQVNRDAPFSQRLLCAITAPWPAGFQPCADPAFQPLVAVADPEPSQVSR